MEALNIPVLSEAVTRASLLRIRCELEPAASDGLVYPPTYDQGNHVFRPAWVEGEERMAVLLDSVQSQANRVEMALLEAYKRGDIDYPEIRIEVDANTGHETYSVLELSHRVYDVALRMTTVDGVAFPDTEIGKAIYASRAVHAAGLFSHAPVTLVLGGWDSHGGGGPLVAKLPRTLTSEIVGLDAKPVDRGAVKFDPMDIRKAAGPLYVSSDPKRLVEIDKTKLPKADQKGKPKEKKPSEVGLGNVPAYEERGAVITSAIQTSLISLAAVRRLGFEDAGGERTVVGDNAGRTVTAALGLYGLLSQMEAGYNLRSGCDLIPRREPVLEVIGRTLEDVTEYSVDALAARDIVKETLEQAAAEGLEWRQDPVVAKADDRLVTLIERSRKATTGGD